MSVLILRGDNISPIKNLLLNLGAKVIDPWDDRNYKNGSKKHRKIPSKTDIILVLTNFLNHNAMKHYKKEAKRKELPLIYSTRNLHFVKDAFTKVIDNYSSTSPICHAYHQFNQCSKGKKL